MEDFVSCGLEALIASLDRYDPDKGATLEQFLWTRVHGAVLDELRRQDWAPRSLRRRERDIARAHEEFWACHGRRPAASELAEALATTPRGLSAREHQIASSELTSLTTREREVASLLYVKELTLREIGEVMGVSESRVCQLHSRLKGRLREALAPEALLFRDAA